MLWNTLIHIIAGILGRNIFIINIHGILWCLLVTAVVQGIDMIRVYKYHKKRVELSNPVIREDHMKNFRKRAPIIMPQIYIVKVIFYGLITLAIATIVR